jgi:hypothetical protein
MKQPRLFEDNTPTNKNARRGLWLDPSDCPHLEWDPTETTWPNQIVVRHDGTYTRVNEPCTTWTWTCVNCGTIRGRAIA